MYKGKEYIVDEEELQELLTLWIPILSLDDWEIYVEFAPIEEMDLNGGLGLGLINYIRTQKQATIKLMNISSWLKYKEEERCPFSYDMEKVLVHELLHCNFSITYEGEQSTPSHTLLEEMARALVQAKRMILC